MRTAALLLAPLALAASLATGSAGAAPPASDRALARIGETVRVHGVRVTPLRVIEDSRCPQNARCVWAGRVRISARIAGVVRELTLGEPFAVRGGGVQLSAVVPERTTLQGTIPPRAYRFGFEFRRDVGMQLIRK
ncbi:hypothetical protein [Novosphingobium sp. JCM 18896]|uniref:hypothetical protein n=1 Tax=Novosphingobium sp. JCM 18896 TaxID=2989731 RepID=UPI0022216307|nr:hypothetical protein [Novosphingobium sp. JCM 18896]MCW1431139.1 hypothetical protein [Novosphingobium sp. JCM 18896]